MKFDFEKFKVESFLKKFKKIRYLEFRERILKIFGIKNLNFFFTAIGAISAVIALNLNTNPEKIESNEINEIDKITYQISISQDKLASIEHYFYLKNWNEIKNIRNSAGESMLHIAVQKGYMQVVRGLLKAGVDSNIKNRGGWTPLHHAVRFNKPKIAKLLIDYGADIKVMTNEGLTVEDYSFRLGCKNIFDFIEFSVERKGCANKDVHSLISPF